VQASAGSHSPAEARHETAVDAGLHWPTTAVGGALRLHAWQSFGLPPPQGELQHTPSTQLPLTHWLPPEQGTPSVLLGVQTPPAQ